MALKGIEDFNLEHCIQGEIVHWGKTGVRGHVEAGGWTVGHGERVDRERKGKENKQLKQI